jgi:nucleoside-diphosphate-sugar epimerase
MSQPKNILVTGAAGFIGFHLSQKLLDNDIQVTGLDNLNDYYDPNLKQARLDRLTPNPSLPIQTSTWLTVQPWKNSFPHTTSTQS